MRKYRDFRNDFSAGEVAPEFLQRANEELTRQALSEGLNCFVTAGGSVMRRPGTSRMFLGSNDGRTVVVGMADGTRRHVLFYAGAAKVYKDDGQVEATLTGAPWSASDVFTMAIADGKDRLIITSKSFHPQQVNFSNGLWSRANFSFYTDRNNRKLAPFVGSGVLGFRQVNLLPSGYAGAISIQFDADFLTPAHAGTRIMYGTSQILIGAVADARNASATVIDRLYPTVRVGVSSPTAFALGDEVQGDVTNVRGQVAAIGATTIDVILQNGFALFLAPDAQAGAPGEKLIGPSGNFTVDSVQTLSAPAATNIWYAELISPVNGYPATCAFHRTRLVFAGFPKVGNRIAASAIGAPEIFDLGAGADSDSIQEDIGEDPNVEIMHLVSTEQLLILTDRGPWYVPEGGNRSFTPQGFGFDPISPDPASETPPVFTPEGVVFIDREGRALLLSITGTQRGAWLVTEISTLGYHTIKSPKQLVYSSGVGGRKERIIIVLNGDGTAATFNYRRGGDQGGWQPWARRSGDRYISFSTFNGVLYAYATADGKRAYEKVDFAAVLDSEFDPASTAYPSETVSMLLNRTVVGENVTDASGVLGSIGSLDHVDRLGQDFSVRLAPSALVISQVGRQLRMIGKTWADVIETGQFRLNGKLCQNYLRDTDPEAPPAVVDKVWRASLRGSSEDKSCLIEQRDGEGAPLHVRSITMEVLAR